MNDAKTKWIIEFREGNHIKTTYINAYTAEQVIDVMKKRGVGIDDITDLKAVRNE